MGLTIITYCILILCTVYDGMIGICEHITGAPEDLFCKISILQTLLAAWPNLPAKSAEQITNLYKCGIKFINVQNIFQQICCYFHNYA